MNLQHLFSEPVLEQEQFEPAYPGHGEGVFRVRTAHETVVVRMARTAQNEPFWVGMKHLFGVDPAKLADQPSLNARLGTLSSIHVPQAIRHGTLGEQEWLIVESLPGQPLTSFQALSAAALEQFGSDLAHIHSGARFAGYGNPAGSFRHRLSQFHAHTAATIEALTRQFHGDSTTQQTAIAMQEAACALPGPAFASFVQVDIDPTQYLTNGTHITALIDTEAHVIAPRELDFIALEYVFSQREAAAFAQGYARVLPLPALDEVRSVYRFLYYLFEIQDSTGLDSWMNQPPVFTGL